MLLTPHRRPRSLLPALGACLPSFAALLAVASLLACGDDELMHRFSGPNLVLPETVETCGDTAPVPDCADAPALCAGSISQLVAPSSMAVAPVRVLSVPEGYTDDDLVHFQTRVDGLVASLRADPHSIGARLGEALAVERLDIVSSTSDVFNSARDDTAFGACVETYAFDDRYHLRSNRERLDAVLARHQIEADVVVMVLNAGAGTANGSYPGGEMLSDIPRVDLGERAPAGVAAAPVAIVTRPSLIHLPRTDDAWVLDHELAHSLLHLGDEYALTDGCYEPRVGPGWQSAFPFTPNLTTDPRGQKWAHLVDGAEEGGELMSSCI